MLEVKAQSNAEVEVARSARAAANGEPQALDFDQRSLTSHADALRGFSVKLEDLQQRQKLAEEATHDLERHGTHNDLVPPPLVADLALHPRPEHHPLQSLRGCRRRRTCAAVR